MRIHVQHRNRIHARILENALLNHRQRSAGPFFGRLKDQHDAAAQLLLHSNEHVRCTQQHRGVRVVSASVHSSFDFRREREPASFPYRQRVHIGPQRRHASRHTAVNAPDDASLRHTPVRDSQRVKLSLDERRRLVLVETELRPAVNCSAQLDHSRV